MQVKKIFLKLILLMLILIVGLICIICYSMFSSLKKVSVPSKAEICKTTKLDISDSMKILGAEYISSLDDSLYIALDMLPEELEKLFPEDKFKPSTTIRYLENSDLQRREWFNPDAIANFKSFSYTDNSNMAGMYVLYGNIDSTHIRAYIFWFAM